MKNVTILTLSMILTGLSGIGFAQRMNPEARADKEVEHIEAAVSGLSDEQKSKLKEASIKQQESMAEIWQEHREARKASREKMLELRDERRENLKEILTKDQYIQYLEKSLDNRMQRGLARHDLRKKEMQERRLRKMREQRQRRR